MSSFALMQFSLSLLAAFLGGLVGWWLRGRLAKFVALPTPAKRQQFAAELLQSLHAAAETVRACIEQHTECIKTIQSELNESTSTEPAVITSAAETIIASNGLVQHRFNDIRNTLADKRQEIRDCLASTDGLLVTFASLDRQKHVYRQVLSSLEVLAAELAGDVKGHGQKLRQITGELQQEGETSAAGIAGAVEKILDVTDEVQRRIAATEDRIASQAETMHMQAILTHTDLSTSLPNRRALEAELARAADQSTSRTPLCTLMLVDLDGFSRVNTAYGHQGGDVILRQAAAKIKPLMRGRDMVARYGGDSFAILLGQTTLHDALPIAERVRKTIETAEFSHGTRPLRLTASVGVAQLGAEEMRGLVVSRVEDALAAAQAAGGNLCFRHDGQGCFAISSAFHARQQQAAEEELSLASLWRDSTVPGETAQHGEESATRTDAAAADPTLTGRSLFAANLGRRLAEWKRGGTGVSVAVVRIDQLDELVRHFGDQSHAFLRQVMGRLLEATTREMDERCEFEDGLFALILPGTDRSNALAVADRLRSQVRQCKVRFGHDLWDLTASIGVAHCTVAVRVMDIMLSAEAAMNEVSRKGGDAVGIGQSMQEQVGSPTV
jgi:diguanylate cyclase (GGDEF)-like protein